jgi:hypothetical protein
VIALFSQSLRSISSASLGLVVALHTAPAFADDLNQILDKTQQYYQEKSYAKLSKSSAGPKKRSRKRTERLL